MPGFRGHGGVASVVIVGDTGVGSLAVPYPSGVIAGDLLIVLGERGFRDASVGESSTPGDWHGVALNVVDGEDGHIMFWKIADGSETGSFGPFEIAHDPIDTSVQETVENAICFAYELTPDESTLGWSSVIGTTAPVTFNAQTGQVSFLSIVLAASSSDTFLGGTGGPTVIVDPDWAVDARVDGSDDYTGPVTGDETHYVQFVAASRRVFSGNVPQCDMDATDDSSTSYFRSNDYGAPEVIDVGWWGVLMTPV